MTVQGIYIYIYKVVSTYHGSASAQEEDVISWCKLCNANCCTRAILWHRYLVSLLSLDVCTPPQKGITKLRKKRHQTLGEKNSLETEPANFTS
jgi:hypothetical protein